MSERVRPFANGDEFFDWKQRNCQRCTLRWRAGQGYQCDLECALDYAYGDNGMVTETICKRLKFDQLYVAAHCPERVLEGANVDSAQ